MTGDVLEWAPDDAVVAEWDALADRTGAHPFVRPGWIEAWQRAFGGGRPALATLRSGGRLVAAAPLLLRGAEAASPTNWHSPEYGLISEDADAASRLARVVAALPARRLTLGFVNADAAPVWLDAFRDTGRRVLLTTLERSPYVTVAGSFDDYLRSVAKHRLSELRRRRRRLAELGRLSFDVDGLDALEEGLAIEGSGWKTASGTAVLSQADTAAFYRDVARWCAERGWLRLCFLRLDGRALAFQYVIEANGVAYFLKGGYDPEFARYAPGMLLAQDVLEQAFRERLQRFEFLGTDEPFKLEWTRDVRHRVRLHAFAASATGLVDWAAWSYGRPAAKRLLATAKRR